MGAIRVSRRLSTGARADRRDAQADHRPADLTRTNRARSGAVRAARFADARAAIEFVQPEAERRGIAVTPTRPSRYRWSPTGRRWRSFNNLLTNAVKYNRDGGTVTVRLTGGERVRIEVADTGIGMTPEETARLFHEFVRIKNEKTRNIPGSGLGLSVVRKLAHLNGGEVTVESSPGVGSTFTVEIAAHSPEAQETEPE